MDFNYFLSQVKSISLADLTDYFKEEVVAIIKEVNSGIHDAFFYDEEKSHNFDSYVDKMNNLDEIAMKQICYSISKIKDYSFNVTVNIGLNTLLQWYVDNEGDIGLILYKNFLIDKKGLSDCFQSSNDWATFLAENMCDSNFVNGILVEMLTQSSNTVLYLLNALRTIDNGGSNYKKVMEAISNECNCIYAVEKYEWFKVFKVNGLENDTVNEKVRRSITELNSTVKFNRNEYVPLSGGGEVITVKMVRKTYGLKALNWIDSSLGPTLYSLRTNKKPSNVIEDTESKGGCVLKGTKILMANGSYKFIEDMKEWDKVYSKDGGISVCSNELVVNNRLTALYSINDGVPFMSLEHAIWTKRGWCSLNPNLSNDINPHFNVKKLEVGDIVLKIKTIKDVEIEYEEVAVEVINIGYYNEGTIEAYDIHFREGYLSYHCNDYICLLNYPEITGKRIMDNIKNKLNNDESERFLSIVTENQEIFQKVFGKVALEYFNNKL